MDLRLPSLNGCMRITYMQIWARVITDGTRLSTLKTQLIPLVGSSVKCNILYTCVCVREQPVTSTQLCINNKHSGIFIFLFDKRVYSFICNNQKSLLCLRLLNILDNDDNDDNDKDTYRSLI